MKKALVIGGSNGIGLAISKGLIRRGYFVEICDRCVVDDGNIESSSYRYHYCDLMDLEEEHFVELAKENDIELLMITAGVGRIADFQAHHVAEIDHMLTINATTTIKILRIFYERINSDTDFYAGVMGSIAGWLISPAASVYAASKAAIVRLIESINIELEAAGRKNRILDVSPSSFKGSRFYGNNNNLVAMGDLPDQIIKCLFKRETRFIPQYEETFKSVLERYHNNPHEYGLYSYNYKKSSGRMDNGKRVKIGYLSGTFDLFHVGHLNLLKRAKHNCDYLIVGVHNSGAWKGKDTFIPFEERKAIVGACKYVDKVVDSCLEDSDAWELWHYDRLFVGSDYKGTERFNKYEAFFRDKGVEIIYFPYTKSTSSTQIRQAILSKMQNT